MSKTTNKTVGYLIAKPLTIADKAAARVAAILARGEVLHFSDQHGAPCTAGAHTPAVGPRSLFAVYRYGPRARAEEGLTAEAAASWVLSWTGAGRAREAAIAADRKAGRQPARVVASKPDKRGRVSAVVAYEGA